MPVETLPYALTSLAEMRRLYGRDAVQMRASDIPSPTGPLTSDEVAAIQDCIDEASDECFARIGMWHDISDEATSNNLWLRRRATSIACYLLSMRRANPGQFTEKYERALADMDRVQRGELVIPRLPFKADLAPGMSNVSIDDRYVVRKVRVAEQISTGGSQPNRDSDRRYMYNDSFIW